MGSGFKRSIITFSLLLFILLIAVFFRFNGLDFAPPALYPDEATNGVNALEALEDGDYKLFYPDNNGREGLYINILALAFDNFGASTKTLRMVSAVFGVLMILGLFFLAKLLWGLRIGLLSSYLAAISFWAINFSRIGFRAIILPAILVWSFYFLWLGIKKRSSLFILLGGLIFGVGMHSYISFRIAPLLLIILLGLLLFVNRSIAKKDVWRWAFVFAIGAIITASPLLLYYLNNPGDFLGRADQVSIFAQDNPVQSLGETVVKTLGMFTFVGDFNWRHNFSARPLLFWPIGIGFIIGLVLLILDFRKRNATPSHFLLFWFLIMLVPNFFSPEGAPHALRALGAQPAVFMISAIGLYWIYKKIQQGVRKIKPGVLGDKGKAQLIRIHKEIAVLSIIILLFFAVWETRTYFVKWAFRAETNSAFEQELSDISRFIISSSAQNKYIIENSGGVAVNTIIFLTWGIKDQIILIREDKITTLPDDPGDALMILVHEDKELLEALEKKYPNANKLGAFNGIRIK